MADVKTKTYQLVINGVKENIDAVEALNKQLDNLDSRLKNQSRAINIIGGGSSKSELSEKEKLESQYVKNVEKEKAYQEEIYKAILMQKNELKAITNLQKASANEMQAESRLGKGGYANTMAGLKQELADVKAVLNNTDLGSQKFKDLTARANELTNQLKEFEKAYGTYSRDVGNYANGVTEGIMNARKELKQLKIEMENLTVKKDRGLITPEEEQRLKELPSIVKQLESSIKDAGKPMDALMDTMQSVVSIASAGKGLAALFGMDNDKINESIQKLVALQNVMNSLKTIADQWNAEEGLVGYFKKGFKYIDNYAKKVNETKIASQGAAVAEKQQAAATTTVATASKTATSAEVAQTTATKGLTVGLRVATVAAKLFWAALTLGASFLITEIISNLDKIGDFFKGIFGGTTQGEIDALNDKMKSTVEVTNELVGGLDKAYSDGKIGKIAAVTEQFKLQSKALKDVVDLLEKADGMKFSDFPFLVDSFRKGFKDIYNEEGGDLTDKDARNAAQKVFVDYLKRIKRDAEEATKAMEDLNNGVEGSGARFEAARKKLEELYKEGQNDEVIRRLKYNLEHLFPDDEEMRKAAESFISILEWTKNRMDDINDSVENTIEEFQDNLLSSADRRKKALKKQYDDAIQAAGDDAEKVAELTALYVANRNKIDEEEAKKNLSNTKKNGQNLAKAEETIEQLRLKLMKDGLRKRLIQLDEEKRKTLEKVKGTAEEKLHIEKLYNDLSLAEIKKYVESVQKEYKQLGKSIRDEAINLELSDKGNLIQEMNNKLDVNRFSLGGDKDHLKYLIQNTDNFKGYWMFISTQLENLQKDFYKDSVEEQLKFFNQIEKLQKEDALLRKQQAEQAAIDEMNIWDEEQKQRVEDLETSIATIEGLGNKATEDQKKQLIKSRKELQYINENYDTLANEKWINYLEKYRQIQQQYNNEYKEIELNGKKERSKIYTDFYETEIQKFNNFSTQLSRDIQKQPELTQIGFINIAKTKKNYEQARQQIKAVIDNIRKDIMDINLKYQSKENKNFGLISPEDYAATMNKLSDLENEFIDKRNEIDEKIKDLPKDVLSQINDIIQLVGQATNSILSSFSEITSNHYDKMIDEQQQYYDKLSDLYDKQKEKTQEYADAVNQIEGDLSNARGDRREQLIDQLNAEMAAQRESLAQEKRIEKEKEEAEHRKADLEYAQAVAKKKMDVAQAIINGLMAASMAAVNHWPIPALPMISLATATSAAQLAAIKSQYIPKPKYGDGGVIQGKSHRDGGVPVLGGRAEVEGGEFITNRFTTRQNVDLLEYINSKRKKIDIADLIDFYSSPKVRSNIQNVRKFADGGQLPLLRNDMTVDNRMLTMMQEYSTRPVWVAVTEIEAAQSKVNYVRAVSGLKS